jgi:hypothetical protein
MLPKIIPGIVFGLRNGKDVITNSGQASPQEFVFSNRKHPSALKMNSTTGILTGNYFIELNHTNLN